MKLNLGCGEDIRTGFVNVDAFPRDGVVFFDLQTDNLSRVWSGIEHILANDIVEHLNHWEAVHLLKEMFASLGHGGTVEIRVPDCEYIIENRDMSLSHKLTMLYGGQDVSQGVDKAMDKIRMKRPDLFCHRYGWTMDRMRAHLIAAGFDRITTKRAGVNFIATARKP